MSSSTNTVSLQFKADSSQAKKEISSLVQELNKLSTQTIATSFTQNISQDMQNASREVGKFATILKEAANTDTGKLDLSKLNQGLKESNTSLPKMANSFKSLGNDGVKAFANVVKQINAAEVPLKKTNAAIDKLWTSMKNTVNWQISSSALHGLMSGFQSAFRYAQDLNTSLNNISIVTGYNTDQMAAFAVEANKAAKALNTTTTAYTDASLIYFQQGLSTEEVKERADVTIKMANVTRQSATEVSNQLTSIWNNFDDGTKSLEYYADVLTKLGAATASSTDEIAGGLEKFAAVADTIGLSYEYAASALATITSNTRQSEEVVGTALKTIFARIQGLNLGETLDDGTTLNKYSEALQKVGISIFDSSGQLKKMDDILDEMGAKWQTLAKDQQVALAQTVAGVRQYNQLVSLMDNWNNGDSDSMTANLQTSYGASGALQEQADIYADSWEAAQKRVQASMESLYDTLIDDDFFIDLLDAAGGFVDIVNNLIGGLGGVKGLLLTISTYVLRIAKTKFSDELKRLTGPSDKQRAMMAQETKIKANEQLKTIAAGGKSRESQAIASSYSAIGQLQKQMWEQNDKLSESQIKILQGQLDQLEVLGDIVATKAKSLDLAEKESRMAERQLQLQQKLKIKEIGFDDVQGTGKLLNRRGKTFTTNEIDKVNDVRQKAGLENLTEDQVQTLTMDDSKLKGAAKAAHLEKYKKVLAEINAELDEARRKMLGLPDILKEYKAKSTEVGTVKQALSVAPDENGAQAADKVRAAMSGLTDETKKAIYAAAGSEKEFNKLINSLEQVEQGAVQDSTAFLDLSEVLDQARLDIAAATAATANADTGIDPEIIGIRTTAIDEQVDASLDLAQAQDKLDNEVKNTNKTFTEGVDSLPEWQDSIVNAATAVTSFFMALNSLKGMWDTLKDPDVSGWEKFTTVLTTLATVIPGIVMGWKSLKESKIKDVAINALNVASEKLLAKAKKDTADASKQAEKAQDAENKEQQEGIVTDVVQSGTEKGKGGKTPPAPKGGGKTPSPKLTAGGAKLAGSLTLIAAGILVVVGTIAWAVHQANAAERALEKAKKSASELQTNYENVKAAYDEFNNQATGYENARDAIDGLTKGTEEYAEAVRSANDAAMSLLDTNENLAYTIENGQIVIDPDSLEEQKKAEQQKLEYAQAAKMAGQVEVSRAKENVNKRDMARKLDSTADDDEEDGNVLAATGAGAGAGALIGAGIGSIVPVIGTAVGAAVGALIGTYVGAIGGAIAQSSTGASDEKETAALESLEKAYLEDDTILQKLKDGSMTEADWDKLEIDDTTLRASLEANADEVAELVQQMAANTEAINAQNDLVAANALADNEAVANSEYQDQIIDIAGDAYGHAYDKAMKSDWVDTWGKEGIAQINGANDEAKKVFEEYLKYAGLEGQGYELTDTTGTDENRKFVYKDKEGNEHEVSLEAMQAAKAAYEASNTLNDSATKLAATFDKLSESSNEADQALLSFVSGKNFEGATNAEFKDIQGEVGTITKNDDGTFTQDSLDNVKSYLNTALGETLTDDVAIRYGYESADAMVKAFATKLSDADEAWGNVKIPDNFKFADDMSLGAAKSLEEQIEQMNLGPLGAQAGEQYVQALNSMLGQLDTEDQQAALEALTAVDWSDWDAMEQAEQIMKDLGVEIDSDSKEWQDFIKNMRIANGAVPDFSKLKSDLTNITGILQKLDFGSVVSEEDYQRLVKYNDEWARFFMLQADGTYKFIGDASQMQKTTQDNINQQRKELEERKKIQEEFNNVQWGHKDADGNFVATDWSKLNGKDHIGTAKNLLNASDDGATGKMLEYLNYDDETLSKIIQAAEQGDTNAQAQLTEMFQRIQALKKEDLDIVDSQLDEMMASTATSFAELNQLFDEGFIGDSKFGKADELTAYEKGVQNLAISGAQAATSLNELENVWAQAQATGVELDYGIYAENLIRLAENYSICTDEINAFNIAMQSGNDKAIKSAEENLEASIMLGEAAEEYGFSQEELSIQAKQMAKTYNLTNKEASRLAIQNQRMNKGVEDLVNNWSDWSKELKKGDKTSRDWAKAAAACTKTIADLVGASEDLELPDDFFDSEENMRLLEEASKGSAEAINKLGIVVASAQIKMMQFQDGMTNISGQKINSSQFDAWKNTLTSGLTELQNSLDSLKIGDNVYEKLGGDNWVNALNEMAMATGMSVEQMQSMLDSMGVQAEVVTATKEVKTFVPEYTTQVIPEAYDEHGNITKSRSQTWQTGGEYMDGVMEVAQLNTGSGVGTPIKFTGNGNVSSSAKTGGKTGGGGGNSAPDVASKGDTTKKSEVVERYKEVTDQISKLGREMDKLSNAQDELWGTDRLNNIQEQIDLIDEETAALERQRDEAAAYMAEDATNVQQAASKFGISFNIEDGYITDYEDQMAKVYQDLADAEATYNSYYNEKYANMSEDELSKLPESERKAIQQAADDQAAYEKTTLEPLREYLAELEEAMGLYEESAEKFRESEDALEEKERQKRALQYQKWTEQLELEIGFDEDDIELFEHLISVLGDNFYQMAEALAYMVGSLEDLQNGEFGGQMQGYLNQLETYNNQYAELNRLKEEGKISDSAYIEGLATIKEGMMTNVAAIAEMDEAMMNYYGDTLDAAMDELSTYTDLVEHSSTVLDHYSSILEILGKSSDLQKMNAILEGQASVAKNQADISAAWYKDRAKDAADLQRQYQNAVDAGADAATIEGLKKKWMDAQAVANEAQDKMLSDAAAWAEALRAVVENELAMMAESLEQDLTGKFGSFDEMNTAMERASSLQEEYLTTTNQVYETNKMIRAAQQEIDKSTNSVAKRRLKQFTEETAELQNQTKLSKYELDIQQAKYDLLLAEIALEEAQQAKSTVRLQRDSEGNFGYVYTADQNQVSDAQQKLEDAQNALYNKGLEGANDYSQKYAETMQEMYDTLTGIQEAYLNGEIKTQTEYNEAMTAAQEYYYQKLEDFSSLYQVAVTTDSRVIKDAWSSDFGQMTYNTAEWKVNVSDYVAGVSDAFFEWQTEMAGIESLVGSSLSEIESNVGNLTANSQDLADTTINEVIPALDDEIDKVDGLTSEYMELRQSILDVIGEYNTLIETMNSVPRTTYNNGTTNNGNNNTNNTNGNNNTNNTNGNNNTNNSNTNNTNNNGNGNTNRGGNTSNGTGNPLTANKTQAEIDATWEEILEAYQHINSGEWGTGMEGRISKGSSAGYDEDVIRAAQQLINYTYDKAHGGQGYSIDIARDKMGFGAEAGREYEEKIAKLAKEHALEEEELIKRKELELEQLREEQALIEKRMKLEEEKMRMEEEYRRQDYEQLLEMHSQAIGGRRYGGSGGHGGSGSYDKFEVFQERELELRKEFMLQQQMMLEQEMKAAEIMKNLDLEKILQTLELQALNAQVGGLLTSPALGRPQGDILEQRVYIEAHFPDVENRNEIEEAFTMLINQASQYANRK